VLALSCNEHKYIWLSGICFAWLALNLSGVKSGWVSAAEKQNVEKKSAMFWKEKGIEDWSPREVQLFLQDSPWAKTQRVTISIKNTADPTMTLSPPVVGAVQMMKFESCCRTFEVPMAGSNSDSANSSHLGSWPNSAKESSRTWTFSARVLWFSSVSLRRAMIRQRELQGVPLVQSEAALAPSSDLVLALSGPFLKLLEGLPPDEVKSISVLKAARGTERELSPAEYIPPKTDADPMAFLIFPKTLEGKPVFSREDGPVTFSMKGIDFKLECQFPLEPMVVDGKLDW
jgi:hypothetical protein